MTVISLNFDQAMNVSSNIRQKRAEQCSHMKKAQPITVDAASAEVTNNGRICKNEKYRFVSRNQRFVQRILKKYVMDTTRKRQLQRLPVV